MNVKVLPLSSFGITKRVKEELREFNKRVNLSFNRNGVYLFGNVCWVEIDGEAFKESKDHFNFKLSLLNYQERPLREREVQALEILKSENRTTQNQNNLLWWYYHDKELKHRTPKRIQTLLYMKKRSKQLHQQIKVS